MHRTRIRTRLLLLAGAFVLLAGCLSSQDSRIPVHRSNPVVQPAVALPVASVAGAASPGTVIGAEVRTAPQTASSAKTRADQESSAGKADGHMREKRFG